VTGRGGAVRLPGAAAGSGARGPLRTLAEAERYLEGLLNRERASAAAYRRLGLGPVRRLLATLGHPERGLCVLHVAGSKGKGSTALAAEALLRAVGRRVGVFTSPHLERWTERFRIDGAEVEGGRLAAAVERLRPHLDRLRAEMPEDAPSFFDAATAAACLLFREAGVEHAVLEVGLGGRLDSTNVVVPAVACITSIELEHTDKLGPDLASIAREKAGIVKPGVPVVSGRLPAEAEAVVAERCAALGAPLFRLGRELGFEARDLGLEGSELSVADGALRFDGRLPLPGPHQAANAALALACVRRLAPEIPPDVLAEAARRGLGGLRLPGRLEILGRRPWLVVDAAHTRASAAALAALLARIERGHTHLVLSISADKDRAAILSALLPQASQVTLTRAEPTRSLDPTVLAEAVRASAPRLEPRVVPNPHLALRAARESLGPRDCLVATGSVYLAGIARRVLGAGGVGS
jgi:dihydrofolate synthase/folylpolyglutamate synthase